MLWRDLWKTKTSPKLRHFLWRAVSGALAVEERLLSRGIHVDPTCSLCGLGQEMICHVLFNCPMAQSVLEQAPGLCPPNGFSQSSVFLNILHLLKCSRDGGIDKLMRLAFPWILWQLWKARNEFCFERVQHDPLSIWERASEEAEIWLTLQVLRRRLSESNGENLLQEF
ncbi:hypothetical protein YC2023_017568 [Brassica napus]